MILAIDTSHESGSIALASPDGTLIEEMALDAPGGFAQVLFGAIGDLLARHAAPVAALTKLAVAGGPGTFTGVRVGLAAAKGIAEGAGIGVVTVSNLAAIAAYGRGPVRAAFSDARRSEVYGAVFDGELGVVVPERVQPIAVWIDSLPPAAELIATTFDAFDAALGDRVRTLAPRALAASIARIAAGRLSSDPAAVDANYVRRSDAEMLWRDR